MLAIFTLIFNRIKELLYYKPRKELVTRAIEKSK